MMRYCVLPAAAIMLICAGCTTRGDFIRPNYDTIHRGQQADDVRKMLGKPAELYPNRWVYKHEGPYYQAEIFFDDHGLVAGKKWHDEPESATQPDGQTPKIKPQDRK